jgi:hypothetical protein
MEEISNIPGLNRPATYEIKVRGRLDESWSDWIEGMTVEVENVGHRPTITTLTGIVADQAALQGVLSQLYALGLSLISVNVIETDGEQ